MHEAAMYISGTWAKSFATRSQQVVDLRRYYEAQLVSPFLFAGAVHPVLTSLEDFNPNAMRRLTDVPDLLKFYATFLDEEQVQENTPGMLVLRMHNNAIGTKSKNKKEQGEAPNKKIKGLFQTAKSNPTAALSRYP